MNYLANFSFGLSILTFASMFYGAVLQSRLKMLRNFNDGSGVNNSRIELVKKRARLIFAVAFLLSLVAAAVCYANQSSLLTTLFVVFGVISAVSFLANRADRKLLAEALAKRKQRKQPKKGKIQKQSQPRAENAVDSGGSNESTGLYNYVEDLYAAYLRRQQEQQEQQPGESSSNDDGNEPFGDVLRGHLKIKREHELEKRSKKKRNVRAGDGGGGDDDDDGILSSSWVG